MEEDARNARGDAVAKHGLQAPFLLVEVHARQADYGFRCARRRADSIPGLAHAVDQIPANTVGERRGVA